MALPIEDYALIGDTQTAALAERGYRDMARMVMVIDRVMPTLVVQEMKEDGLPMRDVSEECRKLVHDAWTRESTAAGMR